ncbi:hypothetical protein [Streptomyces acidiscabies]|uniref:hypothetical protein n=1 Tax=Streptomyces acidiscabies TaxID=42234 RepID=UPI00131BFE47|nr:hypothetical protein [Streptomyces acidiscabies]
MTDVRVRVLEGPLRTEWSIGVSGLFGADPVAVAGSLGLPFLLHFALRGRFAVRFDEAGVTVEDAVDADRPSRDLLEHHGRLFAPLANRGLRPQQPAERRYFDRAVGSLSVG